MAYSAVGTPDYIAPEILTGQGYSFDCDWVRQSFHRAEYNPDDGMTGRLTVRTYQWSLGTIMFECLVGWPPFCAENRQDVYRKIVNWQECLYFPDDVRVSRCSEHLIRRQVLCLSSLTHQPKSPPF